MGAVQLEAVEREMGNELQARQRQASRGARSGSQPGATAGTETADDADEEDTRSLTDIERIHAQR